MQTNPQRTLDAQPCQHWTLFGIATMHQALIRRLVEQQVATNVGSQALATNAMSIVWHLHDELPTIDEWFSPAPAGVAIADHHQLLRLFRKDTKFTRTQTHGNPQHIRLAWAWAGSRAENFEWDLSSATEQVAQGVIHDVASAQSWIRVACQRAITQLDQQNFLLRGVELPKL